MAPLLLDITPLRVNPSYRRLFTGFTLSGIGAQLATVAIGLQVYDITGSTFAVGLVGLCALVPLVVMGLYGGALVDAHDRRTVALVAGVVLWIVSVLNTVQALFDNTHVGVLYVLVGVYNAGFAVVSPARSAIYPRLLDRALLPAANALSVAAMNIAMTVGPLMAGLLVDWGGYVLAYGIDAALFTFAIWGLLRLEPIPPEIDPTADTGVPQRRPGLSSVLDGLRFLGTRPNVRMTFLADFCAMILAQPRALFPAVAVLSFGGGAKTVGLLSAAVAVGAIVSMLVSGRLGRVRRQGLAVVVSVALWGVSIVGFGIAVAGAGGVLTSSQALWLAAVALAGAGACDSVSAVFRTTILQSATPDHLRGRLQGVFVVVVAGGPRLGDLLAGTGATIFNEAAAAIVGGILCVIAVALLASWQRGFLRYDAQHPTP
ncbi:MFS transporter [Luteipulveratus mongoliensis]|uniref:MFS transporter n=1 Tax=Luteipulveratus mongoliensis TaxID=571913 RepID=A0A0K1JF30_9MICO|nr:MFS transporter [Luteipulveratus mongoliensis]AKU15314.1 MFS transporter [Luteipulveratus mongoliensis]